MSKIDHNCYLKEMDNQSGRLCTIFLYI